MEYWDLYDKDEYLITQRSANKSHPLMWECTGGSAQAGEQSLDAAVREVKEELGIEIDKSTAEKIGRTRRYYKGCPDILDVWLFTSNVNLQDVTIQKEEVCNAMWASADEIRELLKNGKFEANAMYEKVLKKSKKKAI